MVAYSKQKYIDYAVHAINSLRRENGLTISEIVKYIKLTSPTEETNRFRPLFDKVKASTNLGISNGLLTRHHNRIKLSSDDDAMSSQDGSEASYKDSGSEDDEEDDASSVGATDSEAGYSSDESECDERTKTVKQVEKKPLKSRTRAGLKRRLVKASRSESKRERRKTAPTKRVDKKQLKPRTRAESKQSLNDASSDDESDSDSDEVVKRKKRKVVQQTSRRNRTSKYRPAKRGLSPRSKSCPAKRRRGRARSKASDVAPKNNKGKGKVEDRSTRKKPPLGKKVSTTAQDAGKGGNKAGKGGNKARKRKASKEAEECGSGSRKKIKEVGDGKEARGPTVNVKVEKAEELKVTKEVDTSKDEYDFYT